MPKEEVDPEVEIKAKLQRGESLSDSEKIVVMGSSPVEDVEEEEGDDKLFDKIAPKAKEEVKESEEKPAVPSADEPAKESPADAGAEKEEGEEEPTPEAEKTGEPDRKKVEEALEEGKAPSMEGWSQREIGLYYDLRRERRRAQEAEKTTDVLRFEAARKKAAEEAEDKEEEEELKPEDFVPVKVMRQTITEAVAPFAKENMNLRARLDETQARMDPARGNDLDLVMTIGKSIIAETPEYQQDICDAVREGENVAIVIYDLIKSDERFESRLAEFQKLHPPKVNGKAPSKEAADKAERIKANAKKPVTSGAVSGGGGDAKVGKTPADYQKMTPQEFGRLPKAERDRILMELG